MADLMWSALGHCVVVGAALAGFFLLIGLVHAFAAKQLTGKWPHQNNDAKRIYDALNSAGTRGRNNER